MVDKCWRVLLVGHLWEESHVFVISQPQLHSQEFINGTCAAACTHKMRILCQAEEVFHKIGLDFTWINYGVEGFVY
jgi:hypothetical protein